MGEPLTGHLPRCALLKGNSPSGEDAPCIWPVNDSLVGDLWGIGSATDLIPLPHPSGASTWHRTEPGRTLLQQALQLIAAHPAWQAIQSIDDSNG